MNRASPSELRKSLEAAQHLTQAGIMFVPMPVLNAQDHEALVSQVQDRLEQMAIEAEKDAQL